MRNLSFNPHMCEISPRRPKYNIFGNLFYSGNDRKLTFHASLHFHARNIILSEVDQIHKKFRILFQISSSSRGPTIGTKFTISCKFSTSGKIMLPDYF